MGDTLLFPDILADNQEEDVPTYRSPPSLGSSDSGLMGEWTNVHWPGPCFRAPDVCHIELSI